MKKLLSILFAFVAFAAISNAQLGLRAGLNLANNTYSGDGVDLSPDAKIGFQLGLTYTTAVSEAISFRPGLLLSTKGSEFTFDFLGTEETVSTTLTYLEVPLDFVYNAGSIGIHAGPYLGYLLAASQDPDDGSDIKEDSKSIDMGLNFGLTYNINAQIGVGVNYGLGLASINETDDGDEDFSVKNTNLSLFVAYMF